MDRLACIDLPAFPLQLLLELHEGWRDRPAAVVDSDRPQGKLLWVNERARKFRILPGMRYAAALSLAGDLHVAEVPSAQIEDAVGQLTSKLRRFTPHVEPAAGDPGVFWLDASGLDRLYPSLRVWGQRIRTELQRSGFSSTVVVGFSRFGTYALAKGKRGLRLFERRADEEAAARRTPLDRLALEPRARDTLRRLGITDVGAFVALPLEGIGRRFGSEVERLHRLASGLLQPPLQPEQPRPPAIRRLLLDHPESKAGRLMIGIERLLGPLLQEVERRSRLLAGLQVGFRFERLGDHIEQIRPAAPTLDPKQLFELIRLRLEAIPRLPDAVSELLLVAESVPAADRQHGLFHERPRRDPAAADRALARLRAAFGEKAVTRARLRQGHLPEASYTWEPVDRVCAPAPDPVDRGMLVRRIYTRPIPLPARPRHEPDGWLLRDLKQGPVVRVLGPYVVSGGWWHRTVHREYHFAETQRGELLWVYYDRARRRWYLHGRVE